MRIGRKCALLAILTLLTSGHAAGQAASSGLPSSRHAGVIRGVVTSTSGKPLSKAHVSLENLQTEEKMETETDKSGRFRFASLYSGKYRLEVTTKHGETATDEFSLGDDETIDRKLVAKRQG